MKKIHLIMSSLVLIAILILLSTVIYGWIISTFRSEPIIVESGSLTMDSAFYIGSDTDKDGVLDEQLYTLITEAGITFNAAMPGEIYTYKLEITNTGSTTGYLSIKANDVLPSIESLYNLLSVKFTDPKTLLPVELDLNAASIELFNDYLMSSNQTLSFVFQIYVKPSLDYSVQNESISIGYFELTLNQIENQ
ncbi:MAG: hypothetical protein RBQ91_07180 [Acholeplasma sp.]|nr:hypothetical protein [Acholeplasma sp.]